MSYSFFLCFDNVFAYFLTTLTSSIRAAHVLRNSSGNCQNFWLWIFGLNRATLSSTLRLEHIHAYIGLFTLEPATASVLVLREIFVFHAAGEVFIREFPPTRWARTAAAVAARVHRGDAR